VVDPCSRMAEALSCSITQMSYNKISHNDSRELLGIDLSHLSISIRGSKLSNRLDILKACSPDIAEGFTQAYPYGSSADGASARIAVLIVSALRGTKRDSPKRIYRVFD
jgi:hypothetical protein